MTRDLEREVSLMCNLSKGIEDRGMEKDWSRGWNRAWNMVFFPPSAI